MPLPAPRRTRGRRLVRLALGAGALALVALVALLVLPSLLSDRPEEQVAAEFLQAFLDGRGEAAYADTTPAYQAVVFPRELGQLSRAVAEVVGDSPALDIVGSRRTPGVTPQESRVGYTGGGAERPIEGLVTLREVEPDVWLVMSLSYDFPGVAAEVTAEVDALTERLNEQVVDRATLPTPAPSPGGSPSTTPST